MENPPLDSDGNQLILNDYYSVDGFPNCQYLANVNTLFKFINVNGFPITRNRNYLIQNPPIHMFPEPEDLQVPIHIRAQVAGRRCKLKKTKRKNLRKRKRKHSRKK
jgi:hypothetical protein